MRLKNVLALTAALCLSAPAVADVPSNARLVAFNRQFEAPELVEVAPKVRVAFAYSYSNFAFIEGKTGIIVVDTGWFENAMEQALADLRKFTGKPVVAIIFTHNHEDHMGGGRVALSAAHGHIPIYGPSDFAGQSSYDAGGMRQLIQVRNYAQTGLALPSAGYSLAGASVGPVPTPSPRHEIVPNTLVDGTQNVTIDGVNLTLIRSGADIPENLMVWLPEAKVLFAGDPIGGVFPYFETPRYEPRRNPRNFIETLDRALSLKPNIVVPGHGRIVTGEKDVQRVLSVNRDTIEFVTDQVERMLIDGKSVDQILNTLKLPEHILKDPDVQPFYHKIDWVVRALAVKRVGFYSDIMDLVRLNGVEEASRLVTLLGGPKKVIAAAHQALSHDDPRWAARLVYYVRQGAPSNREATEVMITALETIASITDSANERNYALTEAGELRGKIDFSAILAPSVETYAAKLSTAAILQSFKTRFKAENVSDEETGVWQILVDDEPGTPHYMEVAGRILRVTPTGAHPDATISLPRSVLNKIYARERTWTDVFNDPVVKILGDKSSAFRFGSLIE